MCDLIKGNHKFVKSDKYASEREKLVFKQDPCAVIICCSDSRVPPEIVFHELNLGQLFVIRVAGPALGQCDLDSIRFAIDNLNPSKIIVLGHQNCGAITSCWEEVFHVPARSTDECQNPELTSTLYPCLFKYISPACIQLPCKTDAENIQMSMKINVYRTSNLLINKLNIEPKMIHNAYYNMESGKVHFFCQH